MGWGWKFLGRSCKASKQQGSTCSLQDVQTRRREPNAKAQRQQQQQQQQQQAQLSSVQFSSVQFSQAGRPC
ncbi:Interphotoreceptor matrix proteoglycan [Trichinella pseudospiralis]